MLISGRPWGWPASGEWGGGGVQKSGLMNGSEAYLGDPRRSARE